MGTFGAGTNPSFTFYAKWQGASQGSVTALVQRNDNSMAFELYDNLVITINGVLHGEIGTGSVDVTGQQSRFLSVDYTEGNTFPLPISDVDTLIVTVQLVNFRPGSSPIDQLNNYRFSFLSSPVSYKYDRPGYLPSPLIVHRGGSFWPIINGSGIIQTTVHSFGRLYVVPSGSVTQIGGGVAERLWFEHTTGSFFTTQNSYTPNSATQSLIAVLSGVTWIPSANFMPNTHVSGVMATTTTMGKVLYWDTSITKLTTTPTSVIAGVSLGDATPGQTMSAGQSGVMFVETTASSIAGLGSAISGQFGAHRLYQVNV
jgi:hypothetical protein